jgi:antitoxin (DNA-binding transcriptional repressor) of toxin-antitoxin stability system
MTIFTVHKAKTELSKLIQQAEAGEEVIIARGSEPAVELRPVNMGKDGALKKPRQPGSMKHLLGTIPDDVWFEPLPEEELKLWEGGD